MIRHVLTSSKVGLGCIGAVVAAFGIGLGGFNAGSDSIDAATSSESLAGMEDRVVLPGSPASDESPWLKDGPIDPEILLGLPRLDAASPGAACFTPGTPPEVMRRINELIYPEQGGARYFIGSRWPGTQGTPFHLTWSFVPDGTFTSGNSLPSTLFATMDAQFNGNRALWTSLFEQSFARWAQLSGLSFTRITVGGNDWDDGANFGNAGSATRGDSRIAARFIDGGAGANVLAFNFFPPNGDMVLDDSNSWNSSSNNFRFLRDVVMHEHGHGLGAFHVCSSDDTFLMEPSINTSFDGPQQDDVRAAQRHYGDPNEPNDTAVDAVSLVTPILGVLRTHGTPLSPSIPNTSMFGIDGFGDEDWYSFTVTDQRRTTIFIEPAGRVYDSSPQQGGNCTSGNSIDSRAMIDLEFELIDVDGSTVLATGDAQPIGGTETVTDILLPQAGDYFIRVFHTGGTSQSQLYFIRRIVDDPFPCQIAVCADPPGLPAFPHIAKKNRYISFTPENPGSTLGFQVELTAGPSAPAALGWVGEPYDPSCQNDDGSPMVPPEPCLGLDAMARIVDAPVFREWNEGIVHLGDCEIVPTATYELRGSGDGVLFSGPLQIQTIDQPSPKFWADVTGPKIGTTWIVPDGLVNVNDVQAAILRFKREPDAPHLTWIDIAGQTPNALVNVTDIQLILLAFKEEPYPFGLPADCP